MAASLTLFWSWHLVHVCTDKPEATNKKHFYRLKDKITLCFQNCRLLLEIKLSCNTLWRADKLCFSCLWNSPTKDCITERWIPRPTVYHRWALACKFDPCDTASHQRNGNKGGVTASGLLSRHVVVFTAQPADREGFPPRWQACFPSCVILCVCF